MRQRQPAICLRATDYSETSQVVHFFTRGAGVVHLMAKGTKRPKSKSGGLIDLLCEGVLVFTSRTSEHLGTLVEFTQTVAHVALRKDAARLNAALYMIELIDELLALADPHPPVFDLLHSGLRRLGRADAPVAAVLAYFQWRLLRNVGLLGEMRSCVSCGRAVAGASAKMRAARNVYFSSIQGGLLCGGCESAATEKFLMDGATFGGLAALAAAEAGSKVNLPDKQAAAVNRMLSYHITQQLGKVPKMARHAISSPRSGKQS